MYTPQRGKGRSKKLCSYVDPDRTDGVKVSLSWYSRCGVSDSEDVCQVINLDDAAQQYESRPVPFNSTTAANKHLNVVELSDGDMLPIVRVMTPTRVADAPDGEVARYTLDSTELRRLQYWLTNEDSGCPVQQ
jgi:hypothetical protein